MSRLPGGTPAPWPMTQHARRSVSDPSSAQSDAIEWLLPLHDATPIHPSIPFPSRGTQSPASSMNFAQRRHSIHPNAVSPAALAPLQTRSDLRYLGNQVPTALGLEETRVVPAFDESHRPTNQAVLRPSATTGAPAGTPSAACGRMQPTTPNRLSAPSLFASSAATVPSLALPPLLPPPPPPPPPPCSHDSSVSRNVFVHTQRQYASQESLPLAGETEEGEDRGLRIGGSDNQSAHKRQRIYEGQRHSSNTACSSPTSNRSSRDVSQPIIDVSGGKRIVALRRRSKFMKSNRNLLTPRD
jgi:hypothetical protein